MTVEMIMWWLVVVVAIFVACAAKYLLTVPRAKKPSVEPGRGDDYREDESE